MFHFNAGDHIRRFKPLTTGLTVTNVDMTIVTETTTMSVMADVFLTSGQQEVSL